MDIKRINTLSSNYIPKNSKCDVFPYNHNLWAGFYLSAIYGNRGAGKTTALLSLLTHQLQPLQKNYKIYYISPTASNDPKVSDFMAKHDDKVALYDDLDESIFNEVVTDIQTRINKWQEFKKLSKLLYLMYIGKATPEDEVMLEANGFMMNEEWSQYNLKHKPISFIIIDDMMGDKILSNRSSPLVKFAIKHRHFYTHMYLLLQNYSSLSNAIRRNINVIMLFPSRDRKLYDFVYQEVAGMFKDKDEFLTIMDRVEEQPYQFLTIYYDNNKEVRICFDRRITL